MAFADDDIIEDTGMTSAQLLSPANKAKLTQVSLHTGMSHCAAHCVPVPCWQHTSAIPTDQPGTAAV
jgi:hypothetical protein